MSNNNKQPLDLTESLLVFDKAQTPPTTTVNVGDVDLGIPEINQVAAAPQNLVQSAEASTTTPTVNKLNYDGISLMERRFRDVKPQEKNDSLGISGINQPDEASTSTPIIDRITDVNQTPYYVDKGDDETIVFFLDRAKRGQTLGKQRPPSICKAPRILRDVSVRSFIPQLVSIGPIHRESDKLKEFEWLKECYLNDSAPKEILEACLLKVNTLIDKIRESYAGIDNYSDSELATMMVMDGCFILEFCFKREEYLYIPNSMQTLRIALDLMLLENQVPFFVLQDLFDCSMGEMPFTLSNVLDENLAPCIKLFGSLLPEKISTTDVDSDSTPAHVLGYMHKRYQLVGAKPSDIPASHSIVELDRSGMKFKPHQENVWSMTIKFQSSRFACLPWFWRKPTLLMPTLVIDDDTELILRNFIAYEQSFPKDRYYFTSYAHAMDMLVHTQDDIAKLVKSEVLVNTLASNQEGCRYDQQDMQKHFYYRFLLRQRVQTNG